MNKVKVLYDLVKVMKSKEAVNGIMTVDVHKDDALLFSFRNEFAKNLLTGQTKAAINTDLNYEGKTIKHQSNTEFIRQQQEECKRPLFCHHHLHGHGAGEVGRRGLMGHLSRLDLGLSILNALQVEEQADKTVVLSLNAADLPENAKILLREKISRMSAGHHHNHTFVKEFGNADSLDFVLGIYANKNYEAEKIVVTLVGTQKDERNESHDATARAELSFLW